LTTAKLRGEERTGRFVNNINRIIHGLIKTSADDPGTVAADFFRLEDGKIVEHWDVLQPFRRLAPEIPLEVAETQGSFAASLKTYLRGKRQALPQRDFLTIVIPELLQRGGLWEILRHPRIHQLKASLLAEPGVQVLDMPILKGEIDPEVDQARQPARNYVVVLVAGVHNATLEAIEYAETLRPTDLRAVSFGLDPDETERLGDQWMEGRIPLPLELEDSPFRDIGE
jgi:hypothetical protein